MTDDDLLRIQELRTEIRKHNVAYYDSDNPSISDQEWDHLMRELRNLEAKYPEAYDPTSPTENVGGTPSQIFAPVQHAVPMMSLDNAFDDSELDQWVKKIERRLESNTSISEYFTSE